MKSFPNENTKSKVIFFTCLLIWNVDIYFKKNKMDFHYLSVSKLIFSEYTVKLHQMFDIHLHAG